MIEYKDREDKIHFEKSVDDKIELIKSVSEVQSKIRDVVSSDFVLSKLTPQEKEYVIEMSNNAFLSRRILLTIKENAKQWKWKNNKWIKEKLNEAETAYMEKLIQNCFDAYMNRIYMIVLLNRNVPKNYLVEKMTGIKDEPEDEETKLQNLTARVKKRLGANTDEEDRL